MTRSKRTTRSSCPPSKVIPLNHNYFSFNEPGVTQNIDINIHTANSSHSSFTAINELQRGPHVPLHTHTPTTEDATDENKETRRSATGVKNQGNVQRPGKKSRSGQRSTGHGSDDTKKRCEESLATANPCTRRSGKWAGLSSRASGLSHS